jgi:hypothetical protein
MRTVPIVIAAIALAAGVCLAVKGAKAADPQNPPGQPPGRRVAIAPVVSRVR